MSKTDDLKRQREELEALRAGRGRLDKSAPGNPGDPLVEAVSPRSTPTLNSSSSGDRKQGRPVGGGETLNWTVQGMVTKQERLEATAMADKAGVTLSTWIRKLVQAALKEEK